MEKITAFSLQNHRHFNKPIPLIFDLYRHSHENINQILNINDPKIKILLNVFNENKPLLLKEENYVVSLFEEIEYLLNHQENYFLDLFLYLDDIVLFFKNEDMLFNIGRGAMPSSLICYFIQITKIDPIKNGLNPYRWLHSNNISIDIDFSKNQLEKFLNYTKTNSNYNSLKKIKTTKGWKVCDAVKKTLDNLKYPHCFTYTFIEKMKTMLSNNKDALSMSPIESLHYICKDPTLNLFFKHNPEILDEVFEIMSVPKFISIDHPVKYSLASMDEVTELDISLSQIPSFSFITNQLSSNLESYSFHEPILHQDISDIELRRIISIPKESFLDKHISYFNKIKNHFTPNFQLKTPSDLAFLMASAREDVFINKKMFLSNFNDPRITSITKDTYGVFIYQEQCIQLIESLLLISKTEAVEIYRNLVKKNDNYLIHKEHYIQLSYENGTEIWDWLEDIAPLTFVKSHALCYSYLFLYDKNSNG